MEIGRGKRAGHREAWGGRGYREVAKVGWLMLFNDSRSHI